MSENKIYLSTFAGGALEEQFQREMEEVIKNIIDPNTDPKAKRKITITITMAPSDGRDIAPTDFQIKSTLAPLKRVATNICVGKTDEGEFVAQEFGKQIIGQQKMKEQEEEKKTENKVLKYKSN